MNGRVEPRAGKRNRIPINGASRHKPPSSAFSTQTSTRLLRTPFRAFWTSAAFILRRVRERKAHPRPPILRPCASAAAQGQVGHQLRHDSLRDIRAARLEKLEDWHHWIAEERALVKLDHSRYLLPVHFGDKNGLPASPYAERIFMRRSIHAPRKH
jgi:hypothetical protein